MFRRDYYFILHDFVKSITKSFISFELQYFFRIISFEIQVNEPIGARWVNVNVQSFGSGFMFPRWFLFVEQVLIPNFLRLVS